MPDKLNKLLQDWPKHTVMTQTQLEKYGISRKLANYHLRSGWLARLGPRAYVRPGDSVGWQGGLYALQTQLGMTVHVAGETALQLAGLGHYVPMGSTHTVTLLSDVPEHLPSWFSNWNWDARIEHGTASILNLATAPSLTDLDCGGFTVKMSSPERAILEFIHAAADNDALAHARELVRGLTTLRPSVVQALLEACRSVKVNRYFLWSAEDAQLPWFPRLREDRIRLGKGKRQLYKGGEYNTRYQITVPPSESLPGV